jgi:hypothetical protein
MVIKKRVLVVDDKPGVIRFFKLIRLRPGMKPLVSYTENRLCRRFDPRNRIIHFLIFLWHRRLALLSPDGGAL